MLLFTARVESLAERGAGILFHGLILPSPLIGQPDIILWHLEQHRIACAPVLSVVETLTHPYFKARNMVRTVSDPILGEVTIPGFPLKFSAYPDLPDLQAPLLGQHGVQVLKEYLHYSDTEIARLQQSGTLYRDDR